MSFILDALKKSENERQRQTKPGLFEARVASPRARFPIWAVSIGALLGVNLLILIWLMTRPDSPAPTATSASATSAGAPAPVTAPASGPATTVAVQPATGLPAERFNPPLVVDPSLDAGVPGPAPTGPASAGPASVGQAPPFNVNDYLPAQVGPPGQTAMPPGTGRSTVPVAGSSSASSGLPTREDLVSRGQQIPEANLSFHSMGETPAKRFVFVNGQRGSEGETLPNGLRIEEIIGDGAILSWNGTRFLVPIQ
jgi:general secretion pathway protein B